MCGIYGYYGSSKSAADIVLSGLKKLDYRGYDSWGIAVLHHQEIFTQKDVGKIENIEKTKLPIANFGLGHTRWATTGCVSQINAHPHSSTNKSFTVVQNGIVENYLELKSKLVKKYFFQSETDTEVIVHLLEDFQKKGFNLIDAVKKVFPKLTGRNTIAILDSLNQQIIAVKNGSPLIVGKNNHGYFISSDILSLSDQVTHYYPLDNFELVVLNSHPYLINLKNNTISEINFQKIDFKHQNSTLNHFPHFMIKEIFDSPSTINQVINTPQKDLKKLCKIIKKSKNIYTIGSGTAGNAAAQIAFFMRQIAHIPVISLVGANASEYYQFFQKGDLIITPSQSGETADVLEVLEFAKSKGVAIVSYVNMPGSSMSRLSDISFLANAGPEICVMSTKIFTSQIAWGYLLAKSIVNQYSSAIFCLKKITTSINYYLNHSSNHSKIKEIADQILYINDIFLLGQDENWQIAREGMIKLIEGTYKHAHAIPAGDLKHYAITLIGPNIYTLAITGLSSNINNSINEIKSRGGKIIGISHKKQNNFDFFIKVPDFCEGSSIFNIIPLQLLAYYLSVKLGNNVDKPRNIAKSVTVK